MSPNSQSQPYVKGEPMPSTIPKPQGYRKIFIPTGSSVKINGDEFTGIPYSKMSRLNTLYSDEDQDLLDIVCGISKPARSLFSEIKKNMNWKTNEATLNSPATRSESTIRSRALKELREVGLVRKIRKNSFMISPYHLVPNSSELGQIMVDRWKILK